MANITPANSYDYSSLTALTKEQYIPKLVDNIKKKSILLSRLLGKSKPNASGNAIHQPVEWADSESLGFYEKYDQLNVAPQEFAHEALYSWSQAYASVSISGFEERVNDNPEKLIDLMGSKMRNAEKSLTKKFSDALYGVSGADSVGNFVSLKDIASQSSALGNISPTANSNKYAFWKGAFDTDTGTDYDTFANLKAGIPAIMRSGFAKMSVDSGDKPSLIVCTQVFFDAMEDYLSDKKRTPTLASSEVADGGFLGMKWRGVDVVVDQSCPDGEVYFINEDYLMMKHSRKANFGFTGFKAPVNQDAKTGHILWMGQLVCSNRAKAVGRFHGIGATS